MGVVPGALKQRRDLDTTFDRVCQSSANLNARKSGIANQQNFPFGLADEVRKDCNGQTAP
jgi:hypothetical protein